MLSRTPLTACATSNAKEEVPLAPEAGAFFVFVSCDAPGSHGLARTDLFARGFIEGATTQPLSAITGEGRAPRVHTRRLPIPPRSKHNPVITIGRLSGSDVVLDDPSVSRYHAFLRQQQDGGYILHDAGSSNGTFVDGVRIAVNRGVPLASGQSVSFGNLAMVFVVGG